jgi:hypothetical protein
MLIRKTDPPIPAKPEPVRLPAPVRHLNEVELSNRWGVSTRTLQRWRWSKQGVPYVKLGGRVVYRLEDIEAYEAAQLRLAKENRIVGTWR